MSRMTFSYLAVFVFTLLAVSLSLAEVAGGAPLTNLPALMLSGPFLYWLGSIALIALTVSITGVALASTAGYALSRFGFRGRSAALDSLFVIQLVPAAMVLLPLCLILIRLGLINSYLVVIIIYTAIALPFCVWQMKGYYDTIPLALEEAAAIDGCTRWQSFRLVVFPVAAPALVMTALFSFMTAWNEYIVAAIALRDLNIVVLPLELKMFQFYTAGAVMVSIPVVALFLFSSRFLITRRQALRN